MATEFQREPLSPAFSARPLHILAAEDVAVNRELIRLFLEPRGYEVDTVCNGFEAVEATARIDYDLVLMDMQMPGMDGMDASRAIRKRGGAYAALPIIALSANIIPAQIQLCLDSGMTAHLAKPFTSDQLHAAVQRWSGRHQIKENAVLRVFIDQAGWPSVRSLLDMLQAQIAAFESCSPDDVVHLGRHAHALRGAAGALGYAGLAAVCGDLESACRVSKNPLITLALAHKATKVTKAEIARELLRAA